MMHLKAGRKSAQAVCMTVAVSLLGLIVFPLQALANPVVTVSVVGRHATLLPPIQVEIGNGSSEATPWNGEGKMPHSCPNDTAYQAFEDAVKGNWDRELYVETLLGETLTWSPNEEYWILYYDNNYAEWGVCSQVLKNGDTVLFQAGVSGPESEEWVPQSVPLDLSFVSPKSGIVKQGHTLLVHVVEWKPSTTIGVEEPKGSGHWVIPPSKEEPAVGYTVKAGEATATTNSTGEATLTLKELGNFEVQASMPGSEKNWSRSAPVDVCVRPVSEETC